MKKLIALALLAGAGWLGWHRYTQWKGSPPAQAFKQFCSSLVRGMTPEMEALLNGSGAKPQAFSDLKFCQDVIEHVFVVYYTINSESLDETEGSAEVTVTQTLRFDPVGVHSGTGALVIKSSFHGWMNRGEDGSWKVSYYEADLKDKMLASFK